MSQLKIIQGERSEGDSGPTPADLELADLAQRASEGDRRAVEQVLRQVGPSMLRVVRVVLGVRADEAEDVFQESLLALVGALPSFRGECGLRHFGCRIAARTAVRTRRRIYQREERKRSWFRKTAPVNDDPPNPGSQATATHRKEILRKLLTEIPEEQAETLVLRVVLGYSLGDVAASTGAPINTVRSRIRLAKEALRRRIENDPAAAELFEVVP